MVCDVFSSFWIEDGFALLSLHKPKTTRFLMPANCQLSCLKPYVNLPFNFDGAAKPTKLILIFFAFEEGSNFDQCLIYK